MTATSRGRIPPGGVCVFTVSECPVFAASAATPAMRPGARPPADLTRCGRGMIRTADLLVRRQSLGLLFLRVALCVAAVVGNAVRSPAREPLPVEELARRIDAMIRAADPAAEPAPRCDDAAFVRRIHLDFAGRIPSPAETSRFLADGSPEKRRTLIDRLLAGPEYAVRMRDLFHAMLMERRGDHAEWSRFLEISFERNKPWDRIVREILDPDPADEETRGAAFFHTRRLEKVGQQETDHPGLTRDVGRMFLGIDLQCAQCHDHLRIAAYRQADFQGLFVAYRNAFLRTDVKFPAVGEKVLAAPLEFSSVFDPTSRSTSPRVPGRAEIGIERFEKDQEWLVPPDPKTAFPGTPRFRPLQAIARELPLPANPAFVMNIVNRLWFVMLGRGLIEPLDQIHADNPPSHPDAAALLCAEMIAREFDIKEVLRAIALTETYQQGAAAPGPLDAPDDVPYRRAAERRLSAEQLFRSVVVATGPREADPPEPAGPRAAAAVSPPPSPDTAPAQESRERLEQARAAFVKAFGNVPQEPETGFSPSLKSSLFLLNDPLVLDFLAPRPGHLMDRLARHATDREVAEDLYLSIFSRRPSPEEEHEVVEVLAGRPERRLATLTNLAWAMLASTEFCLNH